MLFIILIVGVIVYYNLLEIQHLTLKYNNSTYMYFNIHNMISRTYLLVLMINMQYTYVIYD